MSKRIEKDGRFYRMRRGKLVEIPKQWVGKAITPQTIRKRPSKHPRKQRMHADINGWTREGAPKTWPPRHTGGRFKELEDRRV